ncbi:hypothetical protein LKM28_27290 [Streptomyces sp. CT1-17]|uniref:hypothetical protein n=1 Tax=unclassified Streptomyces TaxID=2593676 RepID=UPI001413B573|nr:MULTISPECIES: hypothetical protein [unclassified Streptomyces]MCC2269992.1 hypothetical protein [Streptomyces sp. CT1-17]QIP73604.1 hypothetical protein EZV63_30370 [Streptomyces sp. VN1]
MSSPAAAPPAPNNLKRIVAASLIGTTIEWYDFFLYGSAAASDRQQQPSQVDEQASHQPKSFTKVTGS